MLCVKSAFSKTPYGLCGVILKQSQVCIVGGGCIGLTLALGLAKQGSSVVLLDAGEAVTELDPEFGLRVSALSNASQELFEQLDVWQHIMALRAAPYTKMAVRDEKNIGNIHFDAHELDLTALGHIVENDVIRQALINECKQFDNLELMFNTRYQAIHQTETDVLITLENGMPIMAKLLVACDGANSAIREQFKMPLTFWDYDHHALVATIKTDLPHESVARQIFLNDGPLAFLPLPEPNTHSIVWSTSPSKANDLCQMPQTEFNKALAAAFDMQYGLCEVVSDRVAFPLKMRYSRKWLENRVILMGDAAHTIHPLAGLGMNLGLKDVAKLLVLLEQEPSDEFAPRRLLREYEMARKADAQTHIAMMQGLKELFEGTNPIKQLVRGIGLNLVDNLGPLKNLFAEKAIKG